MTKGAIAPTGAQLSAAIDKEMATEKKKTLSVKELQAKLLEHHPNWKLPERRVKKFLKRHLSHQTDPSGTAAAATSNGDEDEDDDATMTTTATVSSSKGPAAKRLLKFFKFTVKKKKSISSSHVTPETAPTAPQDLAAVAIPDDTVNVKESETNLDTDLPVVDDSPLLESDDIIEQTRSLEQVYSDDNDGKKNDCQCSESCAVM